MRRYLGPAIVLASLLAGRAAEANCARPVGYQQRMTDAGVAIEPESFDGRHCPDPDGFLRQDVKTGEVVRVETCEADGGAFVDECVGPGTYRYGFARPYECVPAACSTDYFEEVTVTAPMTPGCRPHPKADEVPWGSSRTICSYSGRMAAIGLGFLAVVALFFAAIVYAIVRIARRRRAS
jgi:hypothetical protein